MRVFMRAGVGLLILSFCAAAPLLAQTPTTSAEGVMRGFYSFYLHELNKENYNPLKQKATALKYLTPQLYANAPRLIRRMDADIFICAQDWEPSWEKNFTVGSIAVKGATANTLVTLPSGQDKIRIRVALAKTAGGGWRILRSAGCDARTRSGLSGTRVR